MNHFGTATTEVKTKTTSLSLQRYSALAKTLPVGNKSGLNSGESMKMKTWNKRLGIASFGEAQNILQCDNIFPLNFSLIYCLTLLFRFDHISARVISSRNN